MERGTVASSEVMVTVLRCRSRSCNFVLRMAAPVAQFRPCIDLHKGAVKQIVGSSLSTDDSAAGDAAIVTNFVAAQPSDHFARLYKEHGVPGGHVIMLGPGNEEAALAAVQAYPGGLQVGGKHVCWGLRPSGVGRDEVEAGQEGGGTGCHVRRLPTHWPMPHLHLQVASPPPMHSSTLLRGPPMLLSRPTCSGTAWWTLSGWQSWWAPSARSAWCVQRPVSALVPGILRWEGWLGWVWVGFGLGTPWACSWVGERAIAGMLDTVAGTHVPIPVPVVPAPHPVPVPRPRRPCPSPRPRPSSP